MSFIQKYQTWLFNMLTGVKPGDDNGHQCLKMTIILLAKHFLCSYRSHLAMQ